VENEQSSGFFAIISEMFDRLRQRLRAIRRFFNRTFTRGPALLRRMGIPFSPVDPQRRGFVVVQIDGLSYRRMLRAMRHHQLPFLNSLLKSGKFKAHRFYSEVPTSTPAFQGGLFYGSNDNIPGFQFYDKRERYYYRMGYSDCAHRIEQSFQKPGLLKNGSVFSCVFTGGAEAALFVFSTLLAPQRWRFVFRVWDILLLSFLNVLVIAKIGLLVVLEVLLGVYDSLMWFLQRGTIRRELEFIALRVILTIVTRELITLGAVIDIYRRVPVIYLNFLGYDEHSHVRGPDSAVARWTLRGIDRCIERIYKATLFAEREYDFFVLSDHGQCAVLPFEYLTGETLGEYLQTQLDGLLVESHTQKDSRGAQITATLEGLTRLERSMPRLFRRPIRAYIRRMQKKLLKEQAQEDLDVLLDVFVVSSGPVAFAYWTHIERPLTYEEIEQMHPGLTDRLSTHPAIGMISMRTASGDVIVKSRLGRAYLGPYSVRTEGWLPFDRSPNRKRIMEDIRRLTLYPRAGDICFWGAGSPSGNVSYSYELGAHSGWTDDETGAFILVPPHITWDFSSVRHHTQFYDFFRRYTLEEDFAAQEAQRVG